MAHFTLIRPPHVSSYRSYAVVREPPLGLAYVAGAIESAGHRVTMIDALGEALDTREPAAYPGLVAYGLPIPEIVRRIPATTDAIGISVMFSQQWPHVEAIVRAIAERFPNVPLILGGEHATATWQYLLERCPGVTVCVLGEGELTAIAIADAIDAKSPFDTIPGIALRIDGRPQKTEPRPRLRAPESLPWPAWHLIPLDAYFSRRLYGMGIDRGRSLPIMATRGCPYQCTFCSSPSMWTTRYVARPVTDVVDEIETYVKRYGISNVDFEDLTAFIKRNWILDLCRELERRNLRITYQLPVGTRSEALDREVLEALYRTGCRNIAYAPESGSPRTLERIKKKVRLDRMVESIRAAADVGMVVKVNMMIGFPFEERRDMWETLAFCSTLAENGVDDLQLYPFCPYPGTELYDELRREGVLPEMSNDYFASLTFTEFGQTTSVCRHVPQKEIKAYQVFGMLLTQAVGYASHPSRILRTFANVARGRHDSIAERTLARVIRRGLAGLHRSSDVTPTSPTATSPEVPAPVHTKSPDVVTPLPTKSPDVLVPLRTKSSDVVAPLHPKSPEVTAPLHTKSPDAAALIHAVAAETANGA
ncbi:Radical SAM domain protein [Minicystis rosea]|nr:Radical SAM domain protein [Minicystis rosea]